MRKLFLLTLVVLVSMSMFAQKDIVPTKKQAAKVVIKDKQPQQAKYINLHNNAKYRIPFGTVIGLTNYDLQSNSAVARRIIAHDNGAVSVVWLQDQSTAPGGSTRGSGYAYYDGSSWNYNETTGNETVEGTRAGWPTLMSNGTEEFVASHYRSAGGLYGRYQNLGSAGSNWSANDLTGGPEAMLWPRAASAGDYYYVIAVDDFSTDGTNPIDGLHFYKSDDHGQTWAYKGIMPDFDTYYANGNGDIYAIDAKDSIVAVVYFAAYGDTRLWKSTDYGESWTQEVINDFPVDAYSFTGGNIVDMDNNGTADTLISTDNTGDVIIDNNGVVHVVFGRMRYLDEDASDDGSFSYFPYTDYILYWNETMGEGQWNSSMVSNNFFDMAVPEEVDTIAWAFDLNGNDTIWEFADAGTDLPFGKYFTSLSSFATLGVDSKNRIYCAFTTVMEGADYVKTDATPNPESFRGVWIRALDTTGEWTDPICISDIDGTQAENVFPSIARNVDDYVHVFYQWDNEPGLHIRGDEDAVTDNYILYKAIGVADTIFQGDTVAAVKVVDNININVYPNPTSDYITVSNVQGSTVSVFDIVGKEVVSLNVNTNDVVINVANLPEGTYLVRVENAKGVATSKFVKVK